MEAGWPSERLHPGLAHGECLLEGRDVGDLQLLLELLNLVLVLRWERLHGLLLLDGSSGGGDEWHGVEQADATELGKERNSAHTRCCVPGVAWSDSAVRTRVCSWCALSAGMATVGTRDTGAKQLHSKGAWGASER